MVAVVRRSASLVFVSGLDVAVFTRIGDDFEAVFGLLRAGSRDGADLVVGRLVIFSFLALGVEFFQVPFSGLLYRVVGVAGDAGFVYWATIPWGLKGSRARSSIPLCALPLKLPMPVQSPRCALIVVSRRGQMRLNKSWASSFKVRGGAVFLAGGRVDNDGGCSVVMKFAFWSLVFSHVISISFRDLFVNRGCTVL